MTEATAAGATPAPETSLVTTVEADTRPTASAEPPAGTQDDDFDENLIPEGSRDNFRKYREKTKAEKAAYEKRLNDETAARFQSEARLRQIEQGQQKSPVDLKDIGEMPKLEDPQFKTVEEYTKAVTDWAKKAGAAEYRQSQTQEHQQRAQDEYRQKLAAKEIKAIQKYPDFRETAASPAAQMAARIPELGVLMRDSDLGPDVFYHLCKNPALLDSILKMPSAYARGKELLRLETLVSAPQPQRTTKAPEPMTPVGGGDGNVKALIDLTKKDDVSEYIARRNREELRRRKGN